MAYELSSVMPLGCLVGTGPFHRKREIPFHEDFCQVALRYGMVLTLVGVVKIDMTLEVSTHAWEINDHLNP